MTDLLVDMSSIVFALGQQLGSVTTALIVNPLFVLGLSLTLITMLIAIATSFLKARTNKKNARSKAEYEIWSEEAENEYEGAMREENDMEDSL